MKTLKLRILFLICAITLTASIDAHALSFPRTGIFARYTGFLGGEKGKSFSESGSGFGAGLNFIFDTPRYAPFVGFYYGVVDSKQTFIDDGSPVTSSFFLQSMTIEPGINYYLKDRGGAGFAFFVSGAGIFGRQTINLSKTLTFQRLPQSDSSYSMGGRIGGGLDLSLQNNSFSSRRRWTLTGELSYKKESMFIMRQNFTLDGFVASFGLSW